MKNEIKQLTGLRGIAACVVAITHLDFTQWALFRFIAFHNLAVDLFFCLSAFTLCLVYKPFERDRLDLRAYGIARFARVYPLYLFGLLFAAVTFIRWSANGFEAYPGTAVRDFIMQLLMLNSLPIVGNGVHWDMPSWSLSVEAFCYLAIFPPLFYVTRRAAAWPEYLRSSAVLVLASAAYFMLGHHFSPAILAPGSSSPDPLVYWTAIVRAVCSFGAGWLVYIAWKNEDSLSRFAMESADAVTIAFFLVLTGSFVGAAWQGLLLFVWPLMVVGLMNERSWTARFLSMRPIVWLGNLSYSIYLCHMLVWHVTSKFLPVIWTSAPLRLVVQVSATMVMATASYYFLERPSRDFIRRMANRKSLSLAT
ncbi:acyltransferase [Burkholderia multivorans]|nr:acyltransferase [Burkholderia multivorans]